MKKDTSLIPYGIYCYNENGVCPYWDTRPELPPQQNGYCAYLETSDYERNLNDEDKDVEIICNGENKVVKASEIPFGFSLLWDQCKECGINED